MNKLLVVIIASILEAIVIGFIVKFFNYEIAILAILVQIYIQILIRN